MYVDVLKNGISFLRYYGILAVENTLFYGGKLAGRFIFPLILIRTFNPGKQTYYPECELKSKIHIFLEQLWYILKTGEINKNYYLFGFDRKGKNDFKNYVPWLVFTNARNRKNQLPSKPTYDPYNFVCLLRDKFVFEVFCKGVGIKTPTNIGMINEGRFYFLKEKMFISLGEIINIEMDAFLKRNVSYGGGMGFDVMPLRIENNKIFINNKLTSFDKVEELIGNDNWIVQERIKNQHAVINRIHPYSINTIRIVTVKSGDSINIINAKLRMGRGGRYADNRSSGGISVYINYDTGMINKWAKSNPANAEKYDRHPDTGVVFENLLIPYWNDIVEEVKSAHRLFYGLHSIGWDVCITEDGPILIEGNDNWGTTHGQDLKKDYLKYFKN